jgi:hypothetical protein
MSGQYRPEHHPHLWLFEAYVHLRRETGCSKEVAIAALTDMYPGILVEHALTQAAKHLTGTMAAYYARKADMMDQDEAKWHPRQAVDNLTN